MVERRSCFESVCGRVARSRAFISICLVNQSGAEVDTGRSPTLRTRGIRYHGSHIASRTAGTQHTFFCASSRRSAGRPDRPEASSKWPGSTTEECQPGFGDLRYSLRAYSKAQCECHLLDQLHRGRNGGAPADQIAERSHLCATFSLLMNPSRLKIKAAFPLGSGCGLIYFLDKASSAS